MLFVSSESCATRKHPAKRAPDAVDCAHPKHFSTTYHFSGWRLRRTHLAQVTQTVAQA